MINRAMRMRKFQKTFNVKLNGEKLSIDITGLTKISGEYNQFNPHNQNQNSIVC